MPTSELVDRELPVSFDRPFAVNSMVTTHAQLLLRSGKLGNFVDRIDIVFKDVRAIRMPREFPALLLRHATDDELIQIRQEVPNSLALNAVGYVIEAKPKFAYVLAGSAFMAFDKQPDPNPSSLLVAETMQGQWPDQIIRLV